METFQQHQIGDCSLHRARKHRLSVDMPREQLERRGQPNKRLVKRTRFSPTSTLIVTKPKTERDIQATWYTKSEISQFKSHIRQTTQVLRNTRTAKAMKTLAQSIATNSAQNGGVSNDIHIHGVEHIRGIEHLLSQDVLKVLVSRRRINISKVLQEQELRKSMGENDPSAILRAVSESYSSFTKEWCHELAKLH
ncbi:hypothetical protein ACHAXS_000161 [Conticribra weissflogii]